MTTPYKAAISAAIEFLTNDDARDLLGLHRIRVGGELMTRGALADLLQASLATGRPHPIDLSGIDDNSADGVSLRDHLAAHAVRGLMLRGWEDEQGKTPDDLFDRWARGLRDR